MKMYSLTLKYKNIMQIVILYYFTHFHRIYLINTQAWTYRRIIFACELCLGCLSKNELTRMITHTQSRITNWLLNKWEALHINCDNFGSAAVHGKMLLKSIICSVASDGWTYIQNFVSWGMTNNFYLKL